MAVDITKVKILGYIYEIHYVDNIADCGQADCAQQVIRVNNKITKQQKDSTILHEIIEVLRYQLGLDELSHKYIMAIETGLFAVLSENKEMFANFGKEI